jgi:hypothetical protein
MQYTAQEIPEDWNHDGLDTVCHVRQIPEESSVMV